MTLEIDTFNKRIEELTESIRRLEEELYRVTYVNINFTIYPNGRIEME